MILLTARALTDPQLPARTSNVYTTNAKLGGSGRVASAGWHRPGAPPQTQILATPVGEREKEGETDREREDSFRPYVDPYIINCNYKHVPLQALGFTRAIIHVE